MCTTDCKYTLLEEVCEQRRLLTLAIEKAEEMLKEYKTNKKLKNGKINREF